MAIIRPSLVFEGSHLGDRNDPAPGKYAATLHSIQTTPTSDKSYQLEWVLTNQPSRNFRWIVKQWFPRNNPGLLSQMLWSWKRKKWESFGKNEAERLEAVQNLIGEEALIRIEALDPEKSNRVRVIEVCPLRTPRHPYSAEEESDAN